MQTLSNKQVAEAALKKIGEYSINDNSADGAALDEALFWLDQVVGFFTATDDAYWLVDNTFPIAMVADQVSYNLENALLTNAPEEGVLFVVSANITDGNNRDTPLPINRRDEYEAIENKTTSGTPQLIYVDRQTPTETMFVYPVPITGTTEIINVVIRKYSEDLTKKRVAATSGLPPEWQLWMIAATAAEIGNGPVRKLPVNEIRALKADADMLLKRLHSYTNREHDTGYRTERWD